MLRVLASRSVAAVARRHFFRGGYGPFLALQREAEALEREMRRQFMPSPAFFRPFRMENPLEAEFYRLSNPIVEEDGRQLFKLTFDVRRFKPSEVAISTNAKTGKVTIDARHKDDDSEFSFTREVSIPDGVTVSEMTCRYDEDGVLTLKAPYTPPKEVPKVEPKPEPQDIPIKHT